MSAQALSHRALRCAVEISPFFVRSAWWGPLRFRSSFLIIPSPKAPNPKVPRGRSRHRRDKLKELKHTIANLEKDIADGVANFATLTEEIEVVQGSKDLDKDVAEATEQQNEENEEFTKTRAADSAAEEPLQSPKNRLNVFLYQLIF